MTRIPATDHAAVRLALHRIATGLSPETVANRLGISRAGVYRVERGDVVKVATSILSGAVTCRACRPPSPA